MGAEKGADRVPGIARSTGGPVTAPAAAGLLAVPAAAAVAGGAALAVLVGLDGSPGWQAVRVVAVAAVTTALAWALQRLSPRASGRLAVVAGVPALAIAAGFAPHWAKGGPVPVQVAAAMLAAAGLGLTVGGTVAATRGRRWWRRAAAGASVVLAAAVVALTVGPAVAATNVPRPAIGATPARAGLAYEGLRLWTADGVALAAWVRPVRERGRRGDAPRCRIHPL